MFEEDWYEVIQSELRLKTYIDYKKYIIDNVNEIEWVNIDDEKREIDITKVVRPSKKGYKIANMRADTFFYWFYKSNPVLFTNIDKIKDWKNMNVGKAKEVLREFFEVEYEWYEILWEVNKMIDLKNYEDYKRYIKNHKKEIRWLKVNHYKKTIDLTKLEGVQNIWYKIANKWAKTFFTNLYKSNLDLFWKKKLLDKSWRISLNPQLYNLLNMFFVYEYPAYTIVKNDKYLIPDTVNTPTPVQNISESTWEVVVETEKFELWDYYITSHQQLTDTAIYHDNIFGNIWYKKFDVLNRSISQNIEDHSFEANTNRIIASLIIHISEWWKWAEDVNILDLWSKSHLFKRRLDTNYQSRIVSLDANTKNIDLINMFLSSQDILANIETWNFEIVSKLIEVNRLLKTKWLFFVTYTNTYKFIRSPKFIKLLWYMWFEVVDEYTWLAESNWFEWNILTLKKIWESKSLDEITKLLWDNSNWKLLNLIDAKVQFQKNTEILTEFSINDTKYTIKLTQLRANAF